MATTARAEGSYHGIGYWLLAFLVSASMGLFLLMKPFITILTHGNIPKGRWLLMLLTIDAAACLVIGFTSFAINPATFATPIPWVLASLPGLSVARSYRESAQKAAAAEGAA